MRFGIRCLFLLGTLKLHDVGQINYWHVMLKEAYYGRGSSHLSVNEMPEVLKGVFMLATSTGFFCNECKKIVDEIDRESHATLCEDLTQENPSSAFGYGVVSPQDGYFDCISYER